MILQRILMPNRHADLCREMYLHEQGKKQVFDGYYNLFAAGKWSTYSRLEKLVLKLWTTGPGQITVASENGPVCTAQPETNSDGIFHVFVELTTWKEYRFIWIEWEPEQESSLLNSCFCTYDEPVHHVRMAANICTYRREACVEQNIARLREEILDNKNSPIHGKLDVFIADNGQTLDAANPLFRHENLFLLSNCNAGGSGGFARGLMEVNARSAQRGLTHVIFLDDDAVVAPEAFIRTWALLSLIKPEYEFACIGGELLDLDRPFILNEAGAYYRKGLSEVPLRGTDLRSRQNVMEAEEIRTPDYNGWWYACFSLSVAGENNLPLPFFIHFDDIEYGLRNHYGLLYLNGICVHHANFDKRYVQTNFYYDTRNRLVTNALHSPDVTMQYEKAYLRNALVYDLLRYFYSNTQLLMVAIQDFCRGAQGFCRIDPVGCNDRVRSIAESFIPFEELTDDVRLQNRLTEYADRCLEEKGYQTGVSKTVYKFTLNGWLLPARRSKEPALCSVYHPDLRELFRSRMGILIDPYSRRGLIVKKSYLKLMHSICAWIHVSAQLRGRYNKSAESFRKSERRMESSRFWKKYLGLKEEETNL